MESHNQNPAQAEATALLGESDDCSAPIDNYYAQTSTHQSPSIVSHHNKHLRIVSYNMHGFFQGIETVKEIITSSLCPDVLLIQEHWLTPSNLSLFSENTSTHYAFGVSAMADRVTRGPLVGRPYGGVSILINNELHAVTECVFCTERFVVIRVGTVVIIILC